MKKTAIIISSLTVFMLITTGCEDSYQPNATSNNNTVSMETATYTPPKRLSEVVNELEHEKYIIGVMSVEPTGVQMQVVFTQPYNDIDKILFEYNKARKEQLNRILKSNTRDTVQFQNSGYDNIDDTLYALEIEKSEVESALKSDVDDSLLIRQVTLTNKSTP